MAPSRDVRRASFARLVARVLASAKSRGMTVPEIEKATGVGKSTFYRWSRGEWNRDPTPSQVRAFFEGLGAPVTLAADALGWSEGKPQATEPLPMEPDFETLLRRLADPGVPEAEKFLIRETIRGLASRGTDRRRPSDSRQTG
jgi:transcriptional regulator with XRE-family HTH domain